MTSGFTSLPLPVVPDAAAPGSFAHPVTHPVARPAPPDLGFDADPEEEDLLPGLLPGLPAPPAPLPTPGGPYGSPGATANGLPPGSGGPDRNNRHKILVDRRLLFAGVGALVALVVLFGALALAAGESDSSIDAAPAIATASPVGGPVGDAREALRAMLNPAVMSGCTTPTRSDSAYADATLTCKAPGNRQVAAFHFANRSALDRQIGAREAFYSDEGSCDDGQQSSERWTSPTDKPGGTRLCYFFANHFYEFWSSDTQLVAFSVDDPDPARLNSWWHSFDPLRH
ncbi:hypothetical protein MXD59_19700 [Frankia sp. Ag45/Mut15]|uniref:Septum formation-related domain-containing protein n=1 Tax=Frankia umida TaxID=573489 RepID=A0ABT0K2K1_9ACTN|nr:hypothetical protein [Frankia umida]MCK9877972.1 hypothetical protein [Frankia umida]